MTTFTKILVDTTIRLALGTVACGTILGWATLASTVAPVTVLAAVVVGLLVVVLLPTGR
jgi:hypothetical protein